jgi:hypothetical protein
MGRWVRSHDTVYFTPLISEIKLSTVLSTTRKSLNASLVLKYSGFFMFHFCSTLFLLLAIMKVSIRHPGYSPVMGYYREIKIDLQCEGCMRRC